MKITIKEAAKLLGVHPDTLRRWEVKGLIQAERTPKGHRRFDSMSLKGFLPKTTGSKRTICYARVSSHDQKQDLQRQKLVLETFCAKNGWSFDIIEDLGSGLNYQKKGLKKLIKSICFSMVDRLVVTHKDRLLRFGSELIFSICEHFGVEVIIINSSEDNTFEDDLVQDVLEIITVFSARLYGSRSRKNKKLLEALKDAAESL